MVYLSNLSCFELFRTESMASRWRRRVDGVGACRSSPRRDARFATRHRRCAGMGKVPNYFKSAQKELLSLGGKLIDKMKDYDKDNIPTKIIDKIGPYIEMEAFTPAQVQKASKACTAMCMWVRAMHKYHQVSVMVEPKKKLLAEATAELEETMQKLARLSAF